MKHLPAGLTCLVLLGWAIPSVSLAQGPRRGALGAIYDPQTVETVSGQVIGIDTVASARGASYGVHLLLKTEHGELSVHLGPKAYLTRHGLKIEPHDFVEVTGSRVTLQGRPILIAAQIKKGGREVQLRDARGLPLWRGSGPR